MKSSPSISPDIRQHRSPQASRPSGSPTSATAATMSRSSTSTPSLQVTVDWKDLGFANAVGVRDLWSHAELGPPSIPSQRPARPWSAAVPGQGTGQAPAPPSQVYGAETATRFWRHSALVMLNLRLRLQAHVSRHWRGQLCHLQCEVKKAGVYRMEVDSMTIGTRSFIINVNDGPDMTLNLSGGSSNLPSRLPFPFVSTRASTASSSAIPSAIRRIWIASSSAATATSRILQPPSMRRRTRR